MAEKAQRKRQGKERQRGRRIVTDEEGKGDPEGGAGSEAESEDEDGEVIDSLEEQVAENW